MLNTRSLLRLTLFNFMEAQLVTTYMQRKQKTKKIAKTFIAKQRPSYFLPFRCAYVSHIQFHFTSTRARPASRDSGSPMRVGVAKAKANAPINGYPSHFTGPSGVGGGTTSRV